MIFPPYVIVIIAIMVCFVLEPFILGVLYLLGVFVVVNENQARVYVLFGNVVGVIREPGLHFLWLELGPSALIINIFGQCHVRDIRLDQEYIRSNPVNSEEGAPMGIGVWYEMFITDPLAHVFRNLDPRGSLSANVSSTAEKDAATEFARAAAIRSQIVGAELQRVAVDKEVAETLFEILETRQIIAGEADIVILPTSSRGDLLTQFMVDPRPSSK